MKVFKRKVLPVYFASAFISSCGITDNDSNNSENFPNLDFPLNVVWISCEDIGQIFPMYGDSTITTPNLSRLAKEGITYNNAFSVSGVCSPSRSCLITGMYPTCIGTHNHRSQINTFPGMQSYETVLPNYVKCFTEYLRESGYYCSNNYKTDYNFGGGIVKAPVSAFDNNRWDADWTGRESGQPFFSIFNFNITHMSKLWTRNNTPLRVNPDSVPVPPYFPDTKKSRLSIARLYDNAKILDEQIGELIKKLEKDNLMDNTIIFFFSDHGDGLPRNKTWLYDSGIKVPLIIRFPDKWKGGSKNNDLISFVDFAPTVLSICNVAIPKHLNGLPFLGKEKKEREYVFASRDRIDYEQDKVRAIRNKKYKYIRNYHDELPYIQNFPWSDSIYLTQEWKRLFKKDSLNDIQKIFFQITRATEELYDIINDPFEINNLAKETEYQSVLEEMRSKNEEHLHLFPDKGFIDEKDLLRDYWPYGLQPETAKPNFYRNHDSIKIVCIDIGASIVYRINNLNNNWEIYDSPLKLNAGDTLYSKAIKYGYKESEINIYIQKYLNMYSLNEN